MVSNTNENQKKTNITHEHSLFETATTIAQVIFFVYSSRSYKKKRIVAVSVEKIASVLYQKYGHFLLDEACTGNFC